VGFQSSIGLATGLRKTKNSNVKTDQNAIYSHFVNATATGISKSQKAIYTKTTPIFSNKFQQRPDEDNCKAKNR
jgi:hypothetical protein